MQKGDVAQWPPVWILMLLMGVTSEQVERFNLQGSIKPKNMFDSAPD